MFLNMLSVYLLQHPCTQLIPGNLSAFAFTYAFAGSGSAAVVPLSYYVPKVCTATDCKAMLYLAHADIPRKRRLSSSLHIDARSCRLHYSASVDMIKGV